MATTVEYYAKAFPKVKKTQTGEQTFYWPGLVRREVDDKGNITSTKILKMAYGWWTRYPALTMFAYEQEAAELNRSQGGRRADVYN